MAIEIRIESSWETHDGEGRTIEVATLERDHSGEDPAEDSRWFAGGDLDALKRYLIELVDRKANRFLGRDGRECTGCSRVITTNSTASTAAEFRCPDCGPPR